MEILLLVIFIQKKIQTWIKKKHEYFILSLWAHIIVSFMKVEQTLNKTENISLVLYNRCYLKSIESL